MLFRSIFRYYLLYIYGCIYCRKNISLVLPCKASAHKPSCLYHKNEVTSIKTTCKCNTKRLLAMHGPSNIEVPDYIHIGYITCIICCFCPQPPIFAHHHIDRWLHVRLGWSAVQPGRAKKCPRDDNISWAIS